MYSSEWMKTTCASLMMAALILQPVATLAQDRPADGNGSENNLVEIAPKSGNVVALHTLRVEHSPYLTHDQKLDLLRKHIKYVFVLFQENRSFDFYFGVYPGAKGPSCNAARAGTATEGCTIYVEIMPCMDCARAVVQAGITQVVIAAERMAQYSSEYYNEHFGMVEVLFGEAKVAVRRV